jgi:hypothetical protein
MPGKLAHHLFTSEEDVGVALLECAKPHIWRALISCRSPSPQICLGDMQLLADIVPIDQ